MQKIKILLMSLVFSFLALDSYALNLDVFRPTADNLGTIRLQGTRTLKKYQFSVGAFESYMEGPLKITGFPTAPESRKILNWMAVTDLIGEVGLHDRISVGFDFPFMSSESVDPATIPTTPQYNNHWTVGDIEVHGKFRILKIEDYPVGLTAVPFMVFPSGSEEYYTGDKNMSLGAKFSVDWEYDRFYLVAMAGVNGRTEDESLSFPGTNSTLDVSTEFLYGFGARFDVVLNRFQLLLDLVGSTPFSEFAEHESSSPIEMMAALRIFLMDRFLGIHFGGGSGLNHGFGTAEIRIYAGLTFQHPKTRYIKTGKRGFEIVTEEQKRTLVLKGVYFDINKSEVKPESYPALDKNVKVLKENPDIYVRIEGHTDNSGDASYNKKLSKERADAVMYYYINHGISASRLKAIGMGESDPIVPNTSKENMAKNRRIELHFTVTSKTQKIIDDQGKTIKEETIF